MSPRGSEQTGLDHYVRRKRKSPDRQTKARDALIATQPRPVDFSTRRSWEVFILHPREVLPRRPDRKVRLLELMFKSRIYIVFALDNACVRQWRQKWAAVFCSG